ncbi:HD domain-containing phosphohydrolase [Thermosipho atlanticus]|uniref:Response regulator containing a CheY-like receiver domain and an HD-GYP domain n=1 Tax=Thermosipho atlanticus DSM 15807 TaxID=1123380 RepID=A0A1M5TWW8_9BACT|nr:HD domain-containing phosphohydrolase [Thermosipho atlanticus]SHH55315.1 Response regulator containing a CheY-like receiver domain and an HD-GYP domain [Thermosipho atlanticus DSM 15807]
MNKKCFYLILLISLVIFSRGIFGRNIIVGIYNNKPLIYYENGKVKGFITEILNVIARKENWKLTYRYLDDFATLYNELKQGKIDILLDIAYSDERAKDILFNKESVFVNWGLVYSYDKSLKSILDLNDKTVAVLKGDIYYTGDEGIRKIAESFHLNINFLEFTSYDEVLKAVSEKKAYAGVVSRIYSGSIYSIYKTPIIFSPVEIYFGFSKNVDKTIIDKIDFYLKKWKADSTSIYYELLDKYLLIGKSEIPSWIRWFVSVSLLIILVISVFLYLHRKALKVATSELLIKNKELEELYKENKHFSENLYRMIDLLSTMTPGQDIEKFYKVVLETAVQIVPEADYGSIILLNTKNKTARFVAAYGHDLKKLQQIKKLFTLVPRRENIRIVKDIVNTEKIEEFSEEEYETLRKAAKPSKETLVNEIQLKPELWIKLSLDIDVKSKKSFSEQSKKLISGLGNLMKAFWLEKLSLEEIRRAYLKFAEKLSIIAEAYDDITGAHVYRVGKISKFIAEKLKLPTEKIKEIASFAPLHDIGKIFINRELLRKNERLSEEEFDEIKKHTIFGAKLLDDPYFETAKNIALYHHEKYSGKGYPYGLKNGEIPIEAQIVAIADVYDALRSSRPYKKEFTHEKALRIILEGDGRTSPEDFNPEILEIFKKYHFEIKEIYDKFS